MRQPTKRRSYAERRSGIASLELVLIFPTILLLILAAFGLGLSGDVAIGSLAESRRKAFAQSRIATSSEPLALPMKSLEGDLTRVATVRRVAARGALSRWPRQSADLSVLGSTWDHRDLPLDSPLHLELYATAAKSAGQNIAAQMGSIRSVLSGAGQALGSQMLQHGTQTQSEIDASSRPTSEEQAKIDEAERRRAELENETIPAQEAELDAIKRENSQTQTELKDQLSSADFDRFERLHAERAKDPTLFDDSPRSEEYAQLEATIGEVDDDYVDRLNRRRQLEHELRINKQTLELMEP